MVIQSVQIRSLTPSMSMSASNFQANGVQPLTPTGISISTFGGAQLPHVASPTYPNSPLGKNNGSLWNGFDTVGSAADSFLSVPHLQPVNAKLDVTFDRSTSLSNVLFACTQAQRAKQSEPSSPLGSNVGLLVHMYDSKEPESQSSPVPFVVDSNADDLEAEEERFPIMRRMTKQGPLADSCAPTPRLEAERLPPKHLKFDLQDENSFTPETPITREAIMSSPQNHDFEPMTLHLQGYDNTMLSDTVLGSPQEELFSQGLFSTSSHTFTAIRPIAAQSTNSMTPPPSSISLAQQHNIQGMFTPEEIALPTITVETNLGASDYPKQNVLPFFAELRPAVSIISAPEPPAATPAAKKAQPPITLREATPADAEGIIALRDSLDMTNATSYVWELEDMRERIRNRYPLTLVALSPDPREDSPTKGTEIVVGVTGIDVLGMEKDFPVLSIGSRLLGVPRNEEYIFPYEYCMCRGLLIHPLFQGCGLGSKLHKGRLTLLAAIAPHVSVILSARGSTIEETLSVIVPYMDARASAVTPEFTKDELFEFTFHTSQGIVHMVHGKDRDGWKFVGVDVADGGPVWLTSKPLSEIVSGYDINVALCPGNLAAKLSKVKTSP